MNLYLLSFLICLIIGISVGPLVIGASKKFKLAQTILHYVEEHKEKQGTPTMGGLIFIIPTMFAFCFFYKSYQLSVIAIAIMLSYGIIGFLDDFIKIKYKQNQGLKAYQKIISQGGIALIVAFYAYNSSLVGSTLIIPFTSLAVDIGVFIIPLIFFVYLALVNSVNLTDGLDGLASGVSIIYLLGFIVLLFIYKEISSLSILQIYEYENLILLSFCVLGAVIAFMLFNVNKAKIFMGDTGSLALGGLLTSIAVFSRLTLLIPFIGIMFVVSAVSVIIQVLHFKRTKKRVFLMAPYHHHLQKKGLNENRITFIYIVITMIVSLSVIAITLYVGGF